MDRFVDLHTHSTYSDGSSTPIALVGEARAAGLSAIALTDHDVLDGLGEARAAGAREGLEVVCGVEMSARLPTGEVHILGYEIDPAEGTPLQAALVRLRAARETRMPQILERLRRLGMPIAPDEVRAIAGAGSTGRPHVAQAMVRHGYVKSVDEAFARFLREGGPAYLLREMLVPSEAVALIRGAGGLAAIAHPGLLRFGGTGDLEAFAKSLEAEGLEALECFTSAHDAGTTQACVGIARRLGLLVTGGSDYHGDRKAGVRLGRTRGGGRIPYAILTDIRERLAARPSSAARVESRFAGEGGRKVGL
jgi:hypothetical protein